MDIILSNLSLITGSAIFLFFGILVFVIIGKTEEKEEALSKLQNLQNSFEHLDEQAKLIVKTDLELNRAQEELDKRFSSLDALQKTSRLISTTLEEDEIFHRLNQSLMTALDFERNLILIYDTKKELVPKVHLGFSKNDILFSVSNLQKDFNLTSALKEGHTFSSATSPTQRKEAINSIFVTEHFVLAPILTQAGMVGIVFVGNRSNANPITEGDEELISILSNQIGQSLDNARLFEEVFKARHLLEQKVNERTKELAAALKKVENISKTKSDFISAVSHELRTPLTSIKGYAAILIAGKLGEVPDKVKERLIKINHHSDNLVKLINDLLDISRIESGKTALNLSMCSISNIVENIHDLLIPQMKEKNINWIVKIDPNTPETIVDKSQLERVFINLVGNAVKFTPEEGTISIVATRNNDIITVEVSDTGIGIKEEDAARLFDEFYRVDNTINQNVKGTGLGLALAKKIVEAHEGTMWITSKLNEGTTFSFTLPVKTQPEPTQKLKPS